MSIHDETWGKCHFCGKTIKSWDGNKHVDGKCIILWPKHVQDSIDTTHKLGVELLETVKTMNESKSTNTVANLNICQAADDIIEIFEQQGFTTEESPDIELLRHLIVDVIQKRME